MKNVKELLKKEQQAKDILANIGREKEELAINKLTELKEILAALDCSYLLETNTIEKVVEKEILRNNIEKHRRIPSESESFQPFSASCLMFLG